MISNCSFVPKRQQLYQLKHNKPSAFHDGELARRAAEKQLSVSSNNFKNIISLKITPYLIHLNP